MTDAERVAVIAELVRWVDEFSSTAFWGDDDRYTAAYEDCAERLRKRIDELKNEDHA